MAVKHLDDGRVVIDRMKKCPFCSEDVAIEYNKEEDEFLVTHVKDNPDCPMRYGLAFRPGRMSNYYEAVEMWNRRADG